MELKDVSTYNYKYLKLLSTLLTFEIKIREIFTIGNQNKIFMLYLCKFLVQICIQDVLFEFTKFRYKDRK